jgi:hypothetical protein
MTMTNPTTRQTVLTFSEKVHRLQSSSLLQFITSKGWKLAWNFEADRPGDDAQMPEVEHLAAYILNLRFFVQNNEPTSLRNLPLFTRRNAKTPNSWSNSLKYETQLTASSTENYGSDSMTKP